MTPEHSILRSLDEGHRMLHDLLGAIPTCNGASIWVESLVNLGLVARGCEGLYTITAAGVETLWDLECAPERG